MLETTFEENDKYAEELAELEKQIRDKDTKIVQLEQKIFEQSSQEVKEMTSDENLLRVRIDFLEESLAANLSEKNQLKSYISKMEMELNNLKKELDKTKCAMVDVKPQILIKSESFINEVKYKNMILNLEEQINDKNNENMSCISENVNLKNKIEYLQEKLDRAMDLLAEKNNSR